MYAMLLTAVVLAQPPQPGQPGQPGANRAVAQSIDGEWQVVAIEKDGRQMDRANDLKVTIRNNVVTFSGGDEANRPQAMRIEFAQNGQVRLTEQGAGAGERPGGTPGAGERPGAPGQPGAGERPGSPGAMSGAKSGVYIMAGDYLAVALHDRAGAGTTPGARPGGLDAPGTRPGGAPGTNPPGGTPGADRPGTTPGAGLGTGTFSATLPSEKPSMCVILKRSGAGQTPGSPGAAPDRK